MNLTPASEDDGLVGLIPDRTEAQYEHSATMPNQAAIAALTDTVHQWINSFQDLGIL